jgi:hypothetical protein
VNQYGLAKDEFIGTGNWPRQLYIREARRLVAKSVMLQKDVQTEVTKLHPIGMGSYSMDAHAAQVLEITNGYMDYEGTFGTLETRWTTPYQIPYEALLPREYDNFFVSVCVGASHVAFSSLRMEPQYMIMGEAAGCVSGLVAKRGTTSVAIATEMKSKLLSYGAVMTASTAATTEDGTRLDSSASQWRSKGLDSERAARFDPFY